MLILILSFCCNFIVLNIVQSKLKGSSSLARNRWLVAYTLLKNPSLQPLTASRLSNLESKPVTVGQSSQVNDSDVHTVS